MMLNYAILISLIRLVKEASYMFMREMIGCKWIGVGDRTNKNT